MTGFIGCPWRLQGIDRNKSVRSGSSNGHVWCESTACEAVYPSRSQLRTAKGSGQSSRSRNRLRNMYGAGRSVSCRKASTVCCMTPAVRRGPAPAPPEKVERIVRLTLAPPPHEATHWTLRAMAKVAGACGLQGAQCLEGPRPQPASMAAVQTPERQGISRKAYRHCRSFTFPPPRPSSGPQPRREEPDTGA